ncbi:membrane-spanning protein [Acidovorax sp. SUPP950]|uniref:hypothetical protein n=1 Tax=Acidovorax sp. SUPP950 TaxID=511901 RepID=UPI0023D0C389|nr:hypothetical protein [Acidovorax sp. SUPP950]GKS77445.1 membrane-spanning protein [Acidovorax sp. SUPP950]
MPLSTRSFSRAFLSRPAPAEWALYGALAVLAAVGAWGPQVAADPHQHAFADQRTLWGIAHAMDVLTNLPFALMGLLGVRRLVQWVRSGKAGGCGEGVAQAAGTGRTTTAVMAAIFFSGLLLTAGASALYHAVPHNITLLWDRMGMLVAFTGLVGLAVDGRMGARPAWVLACVLPLAGALSLRAWGMAGQVLPWGVLQGGGMLLVAALAMVPARSSRPPLSLVAVIGWYALAKLLELGDHAVFGWTGGWVSGHSLKHVAAALAAWPVIAALAPRRAPLPGAYWAQCMRAVSWRRPAAAVTGLRRGTIAASADEGGQPGAAARRV